MGIGIDDHPEITQGTAQIVAAMVSAGILTSPSDVQKAIRDTKRTLSE